jgi:FMN phosphatase YigB (HAD superfamily)
MGELILTDCDGVLLDWNTKFNEWAKDKGMNLIRDDVYDLHLRFNISSEEAKKAIREFNESAAIGQLFPFRDSVEYVNKIYLELGYKFLVITSLSLCRYAYGARMENLRRYFGDAIDGMIALACGADKDVILDRYKGTDLYWVEDKPSNAVAGHTAGLRAILMEHDHNLDFEHPTLPVVTSWKEIYEKVKYAN